MNKKALQKSILILSICFFVIGVYTIGYFMKASAQDASSDSLLETVIDGIIYNAIDPLADFPEDEFSEGVLAGEGGGSVCQVFWLDDKDNKLSQVNSNSNVAACCIDPTGNTSNGCDCLGTEVTGCNQAAQQLRNNKAYNCTDQKNGAMILNFAGCIGSGSANGIWGTHGCGVSNLTNTRSATCTRHNNDTNEDVLIVSNGQELYNYTSNNSLGVQVFNETGTDVVEKSCGTAVQVDGVGTVWVASYNSSSPTYCNSSNATDYKQNLDKYSYKLKLLQIFTAPDRSRRLTKVNGNSGIMACCLDINESDANVCKCGSNWAGQDTSTGACNNRVRQMIKNLILRNPDLQIIDHAGCNFGTQGCGQSTKGTSTSCKANIVGTEDSIVSNPQTLYNATNDTTDTNYTDFSENGTTTVGTHCGSTYKIAGRSYYFGATGTCSGNMNSFISGASLGRQGGDLNTTQNCTSWQNCTGLGYLKPQCLDSNEDGTPDKCGENDLTSSRNNSCGTNSGTDARIENEIRCISSNSSNITYYGICTFNPTESSSLKGCRWGEIVKVPVTNATGVFKFYSGTIGSSSAGCYVSGASGAQCMKKLNSSAGYTSNGVCAGLSGPATNCDSRDVVYASPYYYTSCSGFKSGGGTLNAAGCDKSVGSSGWQGDGACLMNTTSTNNCKNSGVACRHVVTMPPSTTYYDSFTMCNVNETCTNNVTYPLTMTGVLNATKSCN